MNFPFIHRPITWSKTLWSHNPTALGDPFSSTIQFFLWLVLNMLGQGCDTWVVVVDPVWPLQQLAHLSCKWRWLPCLLQSRSRWWDVPLLHKDIRLSWCDNCFWLCRRSMMLLTVLSYGLSYSRDGSSRWALLLSRGWFARNGLSLAVISEVRRRCTLSGFVTMGFPNGMVRPTTHLIWQLSLLRALAWSYL